MHNRRKFIIGSSSFVVAMGIGRIGWADKSGVEIDAPESAAKGDEVTIKLNVTHQGNSFLHYTDWVTLKVDGEEVKKWEYSAMSTPEDENFTVEHAIVIEKSVEIEAQANCNNHGSKGPVVKKIEVG